MVEPLPILRFHNLYQRLRHLLLHFYEWCPDRDSTPSGDATYHGDVQFLLILPATLRPRIRKGVQLAEYRGEDRSTTERGSLR